MGDTDADDATRLGREVGRDLLARTMFGLIERALGHGFDHAKLADEIARQAGPLADRLPPAQRAAFTGAIRAVILDILGDDPG